jgi:phosphotransferase system enzyme I (PtsI)
MSANCIYTMLLLGMGLKQISVPPTAIPELKRLIRGVTLPQCEAIAAKVLTLESAREIKAYLKEELKKVQCDGIPV